MTYKKLLLLTQFLYEQHYGLVAAGYSYLFPGEKKGPFPHYLYIIHVMDTHTTLGMGL